MKSDFTKAPQAWVVPDDIHWVLANIMRHMSTTNAPAIAEFLVCDDRGGSGHFWIKFQEDVTLAQARRIVGKDIDVTMEDV